MLVTKTLADVGSIVTGKTPLTSVTSNFGGNIPFVTPTDFDGSKIIFKTSRSLTVTGAASVRGAMIPANSVMVTCIGSDMGKVALTSATSVPNQQINAIIVNEHHDYNFIYYSLLKRKDELRFQAAGGSAQPILNKSDFSRLKLTVPSLEKQRLIAHILGTLDDKIELNRRMSATLEEMARALFKSWFTDFDPVQAKAQGRPTNLPPEIEALFPDSFEDSELGPIPKGWKLALLGEHVNTVKGSSYKSSELMPSTTALVTLKSFARHGGYRKEGLKAYVGKFRNEQIVKPGEVVIACTDVTQAAELIGRTAMVRESGEFNTLVASLDTMIIRPSSKEITKMFVYFLGRSDRFVSYNYGNTTGTTVLHLAKDAVPRFSFVLPDSGAMNTFDQLADNAMAKVDELESQTEYLEMLRDTLLPKLIYGEIAVGKDD